MEANRCIYLALALGAASPAMAAGAPSDYPNKPVRVIVGLAPGGATDIIARGVAQKLTEGLGQSVVIDNRAGAAGNIGATLAAKSPADGYTALIVSSTYSINPSLYKQMPFDPVRDLEPVTLIASSPFLLLVHPSLAVKNVKELIALAKAKPRQLNYGSGGVGNSGHLAAELFASMAGVEFTHVPYKGAGPALIEAVGGHVQMVFASIVSGMPFAKNGKLTAIAVTTQKRSSAMPELPTVAESGISGYDFSSWYGLLVPAGTPKNVTARLNAEAVKALKSADLKERLATEGCEPVGSTPQEFAAHIKTEMARWAKVVKASGMSQ
jgi:tripartite-type tricarboxylate transporter receptor subunit TctC